MVTTVGLRTKIVTRGKKGHISHICRKSSDDRKTKSGNKAKAAQPTKETKQKGYGKKGNVHHLDADAVSSDLVLYKLSQTEENSSIMVKPEADVHVKMGKETAVLPFHREWLRQIKLN